jgi:hypothetical protein
MLSKFTGFSAGSIETAKRSLWLLREKIMLYVITLG